jgi:hypothetical protein
MDANRKLWNRQQKALRQALASPDDHQEAIELFLSQHAMIHSAKMSRSSVYSFADEILEGMTEDAIRFIPPKFNHSIAWIIWHLARIEDVTMNLLVAGDPQVLHGDPWLERMKIKVRNTGNGMDNEGVANLSTRIDIGALMAYRVTVGRRTRKMVKQLRPEELKQKVESSRLRQIWDEGAMVEASRGIVNYWGKRDIAGLLLMPPTRHCFLHLNEARRVKEKITR